MIATICVICREGDCNFITRCHHNFHDYCLKMWLVENDDCPTCRGPVTADQDVEKAMAEGMENKNNMTKLNMKQVDDMIKWCLEKGDYKCLPVLVDRKLELGWNINSVVSDGASMIHLACKIGSIELLNHLVKREADLKKRDQIKGLNCLLYGAEAGQLKVIERLLDLNMSVNSVDNTGATALHIVSKNQNMELIKFLLGKGANIQAKASDKRMPLHYATSSDKCSVEVVEYLIKKGAKMDALDLNDEAPIEGAIINGRMDVFNVFIEKGLNITGVPFGYNLFRRAVGLNRVDFMKRICELGADYCVDMLSASQGATFLHMAAGHGNYEAAQFLIKEGIYVDMPMYDGQTPIFLACSQGHFDLVDLLIKSGSIVNYADFSGKTPLDCALKEGRMDIARLLLATGKFSSKSKK
jgi:ankyrin repeat protein